MKYIDTSVDRQLRMYLYTIIVKVLIYYYRGRMVKVQQTGDDMILLSFRGKIAVITMCNIEHV